MFLYLHSTSDFCFSSEVKIVFEVVKPASVSLTYCYCEYIPIINSFQNTVKVVLFVHSVGLVPNSLNASRTGLIEFSCFYRYVDS